MTKPDRIAGIAERADQLMRDLITGAIGGTGTPHAAVECAYLADEDGPLVVALALADLFATATRHPDHPTAAHIEGVGQ